MSTLRHPVGPEKKSVYIWRRIMVLAIPLAVVGVVLLFIFQPGSQGGAPESRDVQLPEEIVSGEQPGVNPSLIANCDAGELKVTPLTDHNNYAANEMPQLSMSIENIGEEVCQAPLGTGGMVFRITSGSDEIWRSTDCQVDPDQRAVILEPNTPLSTEPLEWDRTRSSTGTCDISRDKVVAGGATYHLHVAVAGVQGEGTAPFLLY